MHINKLDNAQLTRKRLSSRPCRASSDCPDLKFSLKFAVNLESSWTGPWLILEASKEKRSKVEQAMSAYERRQQSGTYLDDADEGSGDLR